MEDDYGELAKITRRVRADIATIDGVVDVDDLVDALQTKLRFQLDRQKSALSGISVQQVAETLSMALGGGMAGVVHKPDLCGRLSL